MRESSTLDASTKDERPVRMTVNGHTFERVVETRVSLGDFLRRGLGLTGTHLGCEHGVCGACTVMVDGVIVRSCLMLAVQADGTTVTTVEGLSGPNQTLSLLQSAMRKHHGLQCGYCTPGVLITLTDFLRTNASPTRDEIRIALTGNLCRCTGYKGIVDAAMDVAQALAIEKGG